MEDEGSNPRTNMHPYLHPYLHIYLSISTPFCLHTQQPLSAFYYSSSFTPLIIFFVVFLAIVRNKKFHHLVRFHAMQAVMIDIVIMLVNIIRMYLPPEFRWSMMMIVMDRFLGATIVATLTFCLWHSIQGQYADIPQVSEAVYIQVDMLESYGG